MQTSKRRGVKWCPECNVPLLGESCDICGSRGRKCANDLKPIFDEERRLFSKLLGIDIPPFAFRYRNRIIVGGKTFLTFQIDIENKRLLPLHYSEDVKHEDDCNIEEMIRRSIKANEEILREKEETALNFIRSLSEEFSQAVVLFGGGKDSTVTAMLAKKALGKVPLLFIDTTLEFPETYQFVERFAGLYGFDLIKDDHGVFYSAEQNFFDLCKKFGPPSIYCRWCCHVFKEQPVRRFLEDFGYNDTVFLTGIRRSESRRRRNYLPVERGRMIIGQVLAQPIIDWSEIEVWLYIFWKKLEINELYRLGHARVGCWPCPCTPPLMDLVRRVTHPELWRKFERVLLAYAKANHRSREWVRRGFWRLRRPKRKKIIIDPLEIKEVNGNLLFTFVLPYKDSLLKRCRVLGDVKINNGSFMISRPNAFKIKGEIQGDTVRLNIECFKLSYVDAKRLLEKFLSRVLNCVGCGACISSCPKGALKIVRGTIVVSDKCDACGICLRSSCTVEDSEELFVVKLTPFIVRPCGEGLLMKHIIFSDGRIGKLVAERLRAKGIKVEIHEDGRVICVNASLPRWRIERIVTFEMSKRAVADEQQLLVSN